jgi:hypothetical protein
MKLVRFFLKLVLYVVMTYAFIVLFEHGPAEAPAHIASEFSVLKTEVEASLNGK